MKLFSALLFSLVSLAAVAQEGSTITVFTEEDTKAIDVPYESVYHNNIKWNVGMLGRGTFMLEYERELTKHFTLESGLGVTYSDILGLFAEDMYDDYHEDYLYTRKYGPALSMRARFYPTEVVDMEGFYVSLAGQARWYNRDLQVENEIFNAGSSMSDFHFAMGWQEEGFLFDDITIDFYFGVAVRNLTSRYYDYSDDIIITEKTNRPALIFGLKYGYPF